MHPDATSAPWYVLHNPLAGLGTQRLLWPALRANLIQVGVNLIPLRPEGVAEVTPMVIRAIEQGARNLIVVGGDGTHHHAVNGVMSQRACPSTSIKYALFPSGTGNDWVRTHQIPKTPDAWMRCFRAQQYAWQDVGLVDARNEYGQPVKRYFTNVLGMAYDAHVVKYLKENEISSTGSLKYLLAIFRCLRKFRPTPLRVMADEQQWEQAFYTLNAGICRYSGGGMQFTPHALPDDGLLAYTFVKNVPAWRVALNTPWLYTDRFDKHPMAITGQSTHLYIQHVGERATAIEADGELVGITPASLQVIPHSLRFLAPPLSL